ncbi:TolB family protein [Kitasatospora sp. NPDC056327]|uniref:TolB family protein n=1 Tax=Kitasatospora sp. NPDC056327 TaxID=3345785 RepID=UPI0035DE8AF3
MQPTHRTPRHRHRYRRLVRAACVLAVAAATAATAAPAQAAPVWGPVTPVDAAADGARANQQSQGFGLTADGRHALFGSAATNLVPGTGAVRYGLYVRDLRTGRTELASRADDGTPLAEADEQGGISADGRYVVFSAAVNGVYDVYVRDRARGRTQRLTDGTGATGGTGDPGSYQPAISGDGRRVVFMSSRADVVPGAPVEPGTRNVYLADRVTGAVRLVSAGADGQPADGPSENPAISENGRRIGFSSKAGNLLPAAPGGTAGLFRPRATTLYATDPATGAVVLAGLAADGTAGAADSVLRFSPDGRYAAYGLFVPPLPHGKSRTELFVHDLRTGRVRAVRTSADPAAICWASETAAITADDRWIYFSGGCSATVIPASQATYDLQRQELATGRTEFIGPAGDGAPQDGAAVRPFVSGNGRTVLFDDSSTNLFPGDPSPYGWQVYARTLGHR